MSTALQLYNEAFLDLYKNNATIDARNKFLKGLQAYPSMCDFYRGEIASRDIPEPNVDDLQRIYNTRESYGQLSVASGQLSAWPRFEYRPYDFFQISIPVTTLPTLHAAYAIALASHGRFDTSFEVLEASPNQNNPWVIAGYTYLYRQSQRWGDLIHYAQKLNTALWLDPITEQPRKKQNGNFARDRHLNTVGALTAGEAFARLGKSKQSLEILNPVSQSPYPYLASEANLLMMYLARREGNHDKANQLLETATSIARTYATDKAEEDPTALLSATTLERIQQRTNYWDATTEPQQLYPDWVTEEQKDLLEKAETILSHQIGMHEVKDDIRALSKEIEYSQARTSRGFRVPASSRHIIFSGPPGTGKTTMAHVIANFYAGYGIVKEPKIIVAQRSDLVGPSEGATAQMTQEIFNKARGGILFIDEAPDMIQDRDGEPDHRGQESISILLQNMENHRDDTAVIIAGYEGGLQRFLATNEGLRSRFPRWIMFETYSAEEIADIARSVAEQRDDILSEKAHATIIQLVGNIESTDHTGIKILDKLGNGRFARNIIERAERYRVERLHTANFDHVDNVALLTLTEADVRKATEELILSAL